MDILSRRISERMLLPLPGKTAHEVMVNYDRKSASAAFQNDIPPKLSAVLVFLYPKNDIWHVVFILRPGYNGVHSNQIGFPGGRHETTDPSLEFTALREAEEEVGIPLNTPKILGKLTDIFIPPSNFIVSPFIGIADHRPKFIPDLREVESIIECPVSRLFEKDVIKEKRIFLERMDAEIDAKYFDIHSHVVWGATAMILSEVRIAFDGMFS